MKLYQGLLQEQPHHHLEVSQLRVKDKLVSAWLSCDLQHSLDLLAS